MSRRVRRAYNRQNIMKNDMGPCTVTKVAAISCPQQRIWVAKVRWVMDWVDRGGSSLLSLYAFWQVKCLE
jgi:hypothetical protein